MAKKSARKEITKINLKQAALEGLSYERACETAKRAGKPSYRFTVGDKVQVGHLLNCVVDEALEGGYMYLIRSGANSDNYSCWAWTNVRPLDDDKDTHFAKHNSALSRLHYSNRSMYSLLSFQYLFGVDFNPDYQRGSVWDDEDREKLLDSIEDLNLAGMQKLWGRKINDIAFGEFVQILEWAASNCGTEVVKTDRFAPSSKCCSRCGYIYPKLTLKQRQWDCPSCGTHHERDVNAAINICRMGLTQMGYPA